MTSSMRTLLFEPTLSDLPPSTLLVPPDTLTLRLVYTTLTYTATIGAVKSQDRRCLGSQL